MYAVSLGNEQGFVIVSGDDRMRPVLAYSDKGDFNESQMPDNMRAWLQEYAREMRWLDAHNYQPAQTTHRAGEIKTAIAPLMVTTWDQGTPYNDLCPLDGGERSVTGCVATAMAQVVYYNALSSRVCLKHWYVDGSLGLAFGARGVGGKNAALAHYEPDTKVINLTKYGGAGCVAHEWFHAWITTLWEPEPIITELKTPTS